MGDQKFYFGPFSYKAICKFDYPFTQGWQYLKLNFKSPLTMTVLFDSHFDCEETKGRNPQNPNFSGSPKTKTLNKKQIHMERRGEFQKIPKIV